MKERPILFSAPMVRALLAGAKTQTRRIAKFVPREGADLTFSGLTPGNYCTGRIDSGWVLHSRGAGACWNDRTAPLHCPYGAPGDHLWVRETFFLRAAGQHAVYRADLDPVEAAGLGAMYGGWKPSIFMPRAWARLVLEIASVRVERVRDITEADAIAEGVQTLPARDWSPTWRDTFLHLFFDINERAPKDSNPWVWVIEFGASPSGVPSLPGEKT